MRLLGLSAEEIAAYRQAVRSGDRRQMPGAVRASAGINTTIADIDRFLAAVADIASGQPGSVAYEQDPDTGDYWPTRRPPRLDERRPCCRGVLREGMTPGGVVAERYRLHVVGQQVEQSPTNLGTAPTHRRPH